MYDLRRGKKMSVIVARLIVAIMLMILCITSCNPARVAIGIPPAPHGNQDLIPALRDLHFDKYLGSPRFEPIRVHAQGWDIYQYQTAQLRCILGGDYFIMMTTLSEPGTSFMYHTAMEASIWATAMQTMMAMA
jgi:hypothetical protein